MLSLMALNYSKSSLKSFSNSKKLSRLIIRSVVNSLDRTDAHRGYPVKKLISPKHDPFLSVNNYF